MSRGPGTLQFRLGGLPTRRGFNQCDSATYLSAFFFPVDFSLLVFIFQSLFLGCMGKKGKMGGGERNDSNEKSAIFDSNFFPFR